MTALVLRWNQCDAGSREFSLRLRAWRALFAGGIDDLRLPEGNATRAAIVFIAFAYASLACGKLPAPSDGENAKATDAAAKAAWSDKVALYKMCLAMDRTADAYRRDLKAASKQIPSPAATAPCTNAGPYVAPDTPIASKPLEASEAHSPPGTATLPPSTNIPAAQMPKGTK